MSLFICLLPTSIYAVDNLTATKLDSIFGANPNENFSFYKPTYFIFGPNDLKLQFSFKYRIAKSFPIYFAYTQQMFWNIYDGSKPFRDINYNPEFFYRLFEHADNSLRTIDIGYLHSSNGKKDQDSRSFDRFFLRGNYLTKLDRHYMEFNLMLYKIFNDNENKLATRNYGYWDLTLAFLDLIVHEKQSLDLELRAFAGTRGYDFNKGGQQVGLIYNTGSDNFNPSIYLQRYSGYGETLLDFNQKKTEYRLGLMLSY